MEPIILGGLAIVICVFLGIWLIKSKSRYLSLALGLVIGGALGNVIDRVIYRAVADFRFPCCWVPLAVFQCCGYCNYSRCGNAFIRWLENRATRQ